MVKNNTRAHTVLPEETIIFQNVQNTTRLTEYQHSRTLLLHGRELVEDNHLSRVSDEVLVDGAGVAGFLQETVRHDIKGLRQKHEMLHMRLLLQSLVHNIIV
jgi:hypothetical protein